MAWLVVHIYYLISFRNRLAVLWDWAWSYLAYERGSRLITGHRMDAGAPLELRPPDGGKPARP
jgi:NADH dehydrogenase